MSDRFYTCPGCQAKCLKSGTDEEVVLATDGLALMDDQGKPVRMCHDCVDQVEMLLCPQMN